MGSYRAMTFNPPSIPTDRNPAKPRQWWTPYPNYTNNTVVESSTSFTRHVIQCRAFRTHFDSRRIQKAMDDTVYLPFIVYSLCALTSALCAILLFRGFRRSKDRLLLWSTCCFLLLAVSNVLLLVDLAILPTTVDLAMLRTWPALGGVALLLFGLIWESR